MEVRFANRMRYCSTQSRGRTEIGLSQMQKPGGKKYCRGLPLMFPMMGSVLYASMEKSMPASGPGLHLDNPRFGEQAG